MPLTTLFKNSTKCRGNCTCLPGAKRKKQEEEEEDDIEITSEIPSNSAEFSMSLSERVKRRRRQVSYAENDDSDSGEAPVSNGRDNDFQIPVSRRFTHRHAPVEEEESSRTEDASASEGEP